MTNPTACQLKPCPFCGSESYISHESDYDGFGRFLFVECRKCRARSGGQFVSNGNECPQTYQEVRDAWNTRPDSGEAVAWYHNDFGTVELSRIHRVGWKPLYDNPPTPSPDLSPITALVGKWREALEAWVAWEDGLVSGMADRRERAMYLTRAALTHADELQAALTQVGIG